MATKPRLPNVVIAALEDITAITGDLRPELRELSRIGQQRGDLALLVRLNSVILGVGDIDRLARNARNGRYEVR